MNRYTNQQLTSAEVIELVELAKEVAAEASRGSHFTPPLSSDELAYHDAVATNESALDVQGEAVLAQIARELVAVMRRDVRTDWTVRDDVRAKLRSSIKRLLVKYKYPPDKQPEAIKQVMDQMESLAPRYAEERRGWRPTSPSPRTGPQIRTLRGIPVETGIDSLVDTCSGAAPGRP